jgi:hypothetical protein
VFVVFTAVIFVVLNQMVRVLLNWIGRYQASELVAQRMVEDRSHRLSHDYRNKIMALRTWMQSIGVSLSHEQRQRLQGIINDLNEYTDHMPTRLAGELLLLPGQQSPARRQPSTYLRDIVENVAHEQEQALGQRIAIKFEAPIELGEPFASIAPADLTRIVSNVLVNALEACREARTHRISIEVLADGATIRVLVTDDGLGISFADRDKIFERDFSTKGKGRGKGLKTSRDLAEAAKGDLRVAWSRPGQGTTIELKLLRSPTPSWFFNTIQLTNQSVIVIVDDEGIVFRYWERAIAARYHGMNVPLDQLPKLISLDSPSQLRSDHDRALASGTMFLIDQEFHNDSTTGIEIIEELGLAAKAVLVTNHFQKSDVLEAVERLHLRLLPKTQMLNTKFPIEIGVTVNA